MSVLVAVVVLIVSSYHCVKMDEYQNVLVKILDTRLSLTGVKAASQRVQIGPAGPSGLFRPSPESRAGRGGAWGGFRFYYLCRFPSYLCTVP